MDSDYYVYILFRESGLPFYVGMGKGNRWEAHEMRAHQKRTHKDRLISAMRENGPSLPKVKILEGLSKNEAFAVEVAFIAAIGREPNGPLINQTSGGDGVPGLSEETRRQIGEKSRQRLSGIPRSSDVIARITATKRANALADRLAKGLPATPPAKPKYRHSEETRAKIAEASRGRKQSAEKSRKISEALKGRTLSAERRAQISQVQIGRVQPRKLVEKRTARSREAYMLLSAERRSAITRQGWETRRARKMQCELDAFRPTET